MSEQLVQTDPDCLFCKIAAGNIPSKMVYQDEEFYAFHDIHPSAPVHFLIIPRLHIPSMALLTEAHATHHGAAAETGTARGLQPVPGRRLSHGVQHWRGWRPGHSPPAHSHHGGPAALAAGLIAFAGVP